MRHQYARSLPNPSCLQSRLLCLQSCLTQFVLLHHQLPKPEGHARLLQLTVTLHLPLPYQSAPTKTQPWIVALHLSQHRVGTRMLTLLRSIHLHPHQHLLDSSPQPHSLLLFDRCKPHMSVLRQLLHLLQVQHLTHVLLGYRDHREPESLIVCTVRLTGSLV